MEQTRWGRITWQFGKNVPTVLKVAWTEAKRDVLGEETDAVIFPFVPRDQKKFKKVLDVGQGGEAYCSTASTEAPVL